ncbi:MAG: HD-GYP domain-containing protein [Phycisphaerales bacterium]
MPIVHAKPGMVLSMPVHHPACPAVVLLRPGAEIEASSLRRLREIGVPELWIRYPALDELAEIVHPEVQGACRDLVGIIGGAIDEVVLRAHARLDYPSYKRGVVGLLEQLSEHPKAALFLGEMVGQQRPALRHAANVCMLAILMGLKLEFYLIKERSRLSGGAAKEISGLGVGAMLHDVGMLRLPDQVLARWNSRLDESDPEWQQHVLSGFDMVRGEIDPTASAIVLHHHQKYDGSGFPRKRDLNGVDHRVSGSEIHVFARIVAAADLFDRLKNPPTGSPGVPAVRALNQLRSAPYSKWIDPVVFRALLAIAPPYPPGSLVTITGGQRAAVGAWFPDSPCQPLVYPIASLDAETSRHAPRRRITPLDLRTSPDVQIVEFEGFDVSGDNFAPAYKGEFDLIAFEKAMDNRAAELGASVDELRRVG